MKATLLKTVVCVTLVFAGVLNANLSAGNKYVTNNEVKNGQVVSKTIYLNEEGLTRHMKYNYAYNEAGDTTEKEAFKWDNDLNKWVRYYKMNFTYSNNKLIMDFARWNFYEGKYNLLKEKTEYELDGANAPVSYTTYKWNDTSDTWAFINKTSYEPNATLSASVQ